MTMLWIKNFAQYGQRDNSVVEKKTCVLYLKIEVHTLRTQIKAGQAW